MTLFLPVFQTDLFPITVLRVFAIDAVQLQVSGRFGELHIAPAMCMALPEIVADCGLVNQRKMVPSVLLPLMRVP